MRNKNSQTGSEAAFGEVSELFSRIVFHLKPAVELVDRISKVDPLSFGQKLSQLGPLLQTEVVANKVSIDAVPSSLLGVVKDVRSWKMASIKRHL